MKETTTTVVALAILLNLFSYCSANELKTKKDYERALAQKNVEIEKLKRQLAEKEKEIRRLKELCHKHGIKITKEIPLPALNEVKEFKVLDKPIFDIFLGEDLTNLKKRYTVKLLSDKDEFRKSYFVNINSPSVRHSGITVFNNQVSSIFVLLNDSSSSNYNAVLNQIKSKYKVLKEEEPISMDDEHNFLVSVDGEDVVIYVTREENFMEDDELRIIYIYRKIEEVVKQKEEDKKAAKIKDEL